jgi:hypothetical protein
MTAGFHDWRRSVYCPNCGKSNEPAPDVSCAKCGLPLGRVVEHIEANRAILESTARKARESRERLLGPALFVAIASIPIGIAAKNTLQESKALTRPNRQ